MFLSAVSFAKSKSKNILVRMVSQAGTGFSFNTKRSRLREKLTLLHYDPYGGVIGNEFTFLPETTKKRTVQVTKDSDLWGKGNRLVLVNTQTKWKVVYSLLTYTSLRVFRCYETIITQAPVLSSESKSPLCGTEKNTLPLNNGLKMHLIYK